MDVSVTRYVTASDRDKTKSEAEIPFPPGGDAGTPSHLSSHYTGGEAKTLSLRRLWIVMQLVALAMGLGRGCKFSHHFHYLLFH